MKTSTLLLAWLWLLLGLAGLGLIGWVAWVFRDGDSSDASAITAAYLAAFACITVTGGWSGPVLTATVALLRRRPWGWSLLYGSVLVYTVLWGLCFLASLSSVARLVQRAPSAQLAAGTTVMLLGGGLLVCTLLVLRDDPPSRWGGPAPRPRARLSHR